MDQEKAEMTGALGLRRPALVLAALVVLLLAPGLLLSTPARAAGTTLDIRVAADGWGQAETPEIATLLQAVADALITRPEQVPPHPIVVSHGEGNPLTLYAKGAQGEYQVQLSARDRRWPQYAYQFGHELCHILAGYDAGHGETRQSAPTNPHQWFEEALCETAALYTLRTLAAAWEVAPPYPGWEDYAPAFQAYADRLLGEQHRRLPEQVTLAAWLHENEAGLRNHPYLRDQNEVVANQLLPLFENQPQGWQALAALNRDRAMESAMGAGNDDVFHHLQRWYGNAETPQRPFLRSVLALLGVAPATAPGKMLPGRPGTSADFGTAGPIGP